MDGPNGKREFALLEKEKAQIEAELGFPLTWRNPENKAMCRLYTRQDSDFTNEALWPAEFAWLKQRLEKMHSVFAPRMKQLAGLASE